MSIAAARSIRVVIADDHPIFRDGLKLLLEEAEGFEVVGEAGDGEEAVRLARELKPDILLLDLAMPRADGLEALKELSSTSEPPLVLVLTVEIDDAQRLEVLRLGARGILLKGATTELLYKAIRTVVAGQYWVGNETVTDLLRHLRELSAPRRASTPAERLTPRERQVIAGVASGESNREIATRLRLSEDTIKHHMTNIFDKLGVSNRAELAAYSTSRGLSPVVQSERGTRNNF
jgi:two-component system nitrate/nitrite response regulator NarL